MECIVAVEETHRNMLMLGAWVPSLLLAGIVVMLIIKTRRRKHPAGDVAGTAIAIGAGMLTLFAGWGVFLWLGFSLTC